MGKSTSIVPLIMFFVLIVIAALIFTFNKQGSIFAYTGLPNGYESLDVDIYNPYTDSLGDTTLQKDEDNIKIRLTASATEAVLDADYAAFTYVWIIKNGAVINYVHTFSNKYLEQEYPITELNPGWNKIIVKIGMHPWDVSNNDVSGAKHCDYNSWSWRYPSSYINNEFDSYSCQLWVKKFDVGKTPTADGILKPVNEDYSNQISNLVVRQWVFNVYREQEAEIPEPQVIKIQCETIYDCAVPCSGMQSECIDNKCLYSGVCTPETQIITVQCQFSDDCKAPCGGIFGSCVNNYCEYSGNCEIPSEPEPSCNWWCMFIVWLKSIFYV